MSKRIFNIIVLLGLIIIVFLSIIVPSNPNEIIKSYTYMTTDMPLWLNLIIVFSFIYITILISLYDKVYN